MLTYNKSGMLAHTERRLLYIEYKCLVNCKVAQSRGSSDQQGADGQLY